MISEHPDGTSLLSLIHHCTRSSIPAVQGVWGYAMWRRRRRWQQRDCHVNLYDERSRISNIDNRKCASLVERSVTSWSCSLHHRRKVCGVRWFCYCSSLPCVRVSPWSETCVCVCACARASSSTSTDWSLLYAVQKKGKERERKKKVAISVVDKTMPIHHPLAAHERANNLGGVGHFKGWLHLLARWPQ